MKFINKTPYKEITKFLHRELPICKKLSLSFTLCYRSSKQQFNILPFLDKFKVVVSVDKEKVKFPFNLDTLKFKEQYSFFVNNDNYSKVLNNEEELFLFILSTEIWLHLRMRGIIKNDEPTDFAGRLLDKYLKIKKIKNILE